MPGMSGLNLAFGSSGRGRGGPGGGGVPPDNPPNYARSFDGIDDEFTHIDSAAFSMGAGVSFEFHGWVKPTNFANFYGILSKDRNDYDCFINITDGKVVWGVKGIETPTGLTVTSSNALIVGTWNRVSLFVDLASDLMGVVVNGTSTTLAMTDSGVVDSASPFALGSLYQEFFLLGAMSRWRLWKGRVNSAAQRTWLDTPRRHSSLVTVVDGIPMNTGLTLSYDLEEVV